MLVIDTSFPARDFNDRRGESVQQVIVHYTAAPFASSLRTLTQDGVSAHYLLPDPDEPSYCAAGYEELRVFRLVDEGGESPVRPSPVALAAGRWSDSWRKRGHDRTSWPYAVTHWSA